jgi:hypothetical protein
MLPHKHYAAPEIEQVLQKQEDSTAPPHECGAEESTLHRWKRWFPSVLTALASHLSSLARVAVSLVSSDRPLQKVWNALTRLLELPSDACRLAWAFFVSKTYPVCLG